MHALTYHLVLLLPPKLQPPSPPSSCVSELPNYFNETQIQRVLNQTELYHYDIALSSDGISGAVLQLGQLLTDWFVHCLDTNLASLSASTTSRNVPTTITANPATCSSQVRHAEKLYLCSRQQRLTISINCFLTFKCP
ncbi:hypothetical protein BDR05DRAFT_180793 [Suillus weaverae]|nr:hypothetical protein BDR05DRAFT_180793 [Suillus weaverae]